MTVAAACGSVVKKIKSVVYLHVCKYFTTAELGSNVMNEIT